MDEASLALRVIDRVGSVRSPLQDRANGLRRGRSDGKRAGSATAFRGYFPPPGSHPAGRARTPISRLCIARQNSRRPPSSAALRPLGGAGPVRPPSVIATKAAMGAADPTEGIT
jgi:hypothetical protein